MYELCAVRKAQLPRPPSSHPSIMVLSASHHLASSPLDDMILPSLPSNYSPSSRTSSPVASLHWDYLNLDGVDEDELCLTLRRGSHALPTPFEPLGQYLPPPAVDCDLLFPAMDLAPCARSPPPLAELRAYDESFASLVLQIAAATVTSSVDYSDPVALDAPASGQWIADAVESSSQYKLESYKHHGTLAAVARPRAPAHHPPEPPHCVAAASLRSPTAPVSMLSPMSVSSSVDALPVTMHLACPAASSPSPPSSTARKSRPAVGDAAAACGRVRRRRRSRPKQRW
jgi:hypothetical protein